MAEHEKHSPMPGMVMDETELNAYYREKELELEETTVVGAPVTLPDKFVKVKVAENG